MGKPQLTLLVAAPPLVLAVLLLSSLHGARAEEESAGLDTGVVGEAGLLNASAVSLGQSGVARATWYGAPNGAGPYDNGMFPISSCILRSRTSPSDLPCY